jgi:hypothetical protein
MRACKGTLQCVGSRVGSATDEKRETGMCANVGTEKNEHVGMSAFGDRTIPIHARTRGSSARRYLVPAKRRVRCGPDGRVPPSAPPGTGRYGSSRYRTAIMQSVTGPSMLLWTDHGTDAWSVEDVALGSWLGYKVLVHVHHPTSASLLPLHSGVGIGGGRWAGR